MTRPAGADGDQQARHIGPGPVAARPPGPQGGVWAARSGEPHTDFPGGPDLEARLGPGMAGVGPGVEAPGASMPACAAVLCAVIGLELSVIVVVLHVVCCAKASGAFLGCLTQVPCI
jgi:hypothetical protein